MKYFLTFPKNMMNSTIFESASLLRAYSRFKSTKAMLVIHAFTFGIRFVLLEAVSGRGGACLGRWASQPKALLRCSLHSTYQSQAHIFHSPAEALVA
jgi:hypothetical protein